MREFAETFAALTFPGAYTFPRMSAMPVDGNPTMTPASFEALPMSDRVTTLAMSVILGPVIFPRTSADMLPGTSTVRLFKKAPFPRRFFAFTFPDTDTYTPDRMFPMMSVDDIGEISAG
ncbi:hypothetical protein FR483_n046L [Paramecium bursaria Chlorella virus FR483]|uniref:Uncharacterized protein n046L n=1 Tax=Paramecium bursaria Chlorella virus FR483 TaxID=399781 RepID=A7J6A0_PBCVF|nr:hypothetical protein FR483_n046L [Paramecium bursaria Chlorella virus FR483]ABT15331.1 hypothetical protein FR483_n046L [Paramecium bursaria Chlorella virus FR483]